MARDLPTDAPPVPRESPLKDAWLKVLVAVICIALVVPSVIVVPMSFSGSRYLTFPPEFWSVQWYRAFFNSTSRPRASLWLRRC